MAHFQHRHASLGQMVHLWAKWTRVDTRMANGACAVGREDDGMHTVSRGASCGERGRRADARCRGPSGCASIWPWVWPRRRRCTTWRGATSRRSRPRRHHSPASPSPPRVPTVANSGRARAPTSMAPMAPTSTATVPAATQSARGLGAPRQSWRAAGRVTADRAAVPFP